MPRPRSERADEAFAVWSSAGARNATETARILGVPASTVRYWARAYGWHERDWAAREAEADAAARLALRATHVAMPDVVAKLLRVCLGEKPLRNRQGKIVYEDGEPVMVPAATNRDALHAGKVLLDSGLLGAARGSSRDDDPERSTAPIRRRRPDPLKMPTPSFRYPTPPGMGRRRR